MLKRIHPPYSAVHVAILRHEYVLDIERDNFNSYFRAVDLYVETQKVLAKKEYIPLGIFCKDFAFLYANWGESLEAGRMRGCRDGSRCGSGLVSLRRGRPAWGPGGSAPGGGWAWGAGEAFSP
jgi:hypothetical protein